MLALSVGRLAWTAVPSVSVEVAGLLWRQMRVMCSVVTGEHRVFVRNLTYDTTADELKEHLEPVGSVKEVTILKNRMGKNLGCAVVVMSSEEDKDKAKNLEDSFLLGRKIYITDYRSGGYIPSKEESVEAPSWPLNAQGQPQEKIPSAIENPEDVSIKHRNGELVKSLKEGSYRGHDIARTVVVWGVSARTHWQDLKNMGNQCCGVQKAVQYAEVIKDKRPLFEKRKRAFGLIRFRTAQLAERFVAEARGRFMVGHTKLEISMARVKDEKS